MWLPVMNMPFRYWDGNTVAIVTMERSENKDSSGRYSYQCTIYDESYRIAREAISMLPDERPVDLVSRVFDILVQRYLS